MTITLYKYNSYFLRLPEIFSEKTPAYSVITINKTIPIGKAFSGHFLLEKTGIICPTDEQFVALEDGELLIIGTTSEYCSQTLLTGLKINEDKLKNAALIHFHKWQSHLDEQMIGILLAHPLSLSDPLLVCAQYTHSDAHSLWIYNPYTEVFTCAAQSHQYNKSFLTKNDKSTLFAFLNSNDDFESREPTHSLCPNSELSKCKTLNRIRIPLDDSGTVAVLNLYSLSPNYTIPDPHIKKVKELVNSKYRESRLDLHKSYEKIEQFFTSDYKLGSLEDFIKRLTKQIAEHLFFECCSIFLISANLHRLKLVATTDAKLISANVENIYYNIDDTSLTGSVAFLKKTQVSYDLKSDKRNSQNYAETTKLPGQNWIGVPIKIDAKVLGVIRAKNKLSSRQENPILRNIRPADIEYMESLATMLASLFQIEELYIHSRKELADARAKIEAQNDFNTVFLHEIKTPISTFALAPKAIKNRVEEVRRFALSEAKAPFPPEVMRHMLSQTLNRIEMRLSDISVMADRLKFIADTYFFDLIVAKNQPQDLGVLQDIVFPVVNITKEYFRRNYGIDLRIDAPTFHKLRVYADQTMLTLVLNALVDNAGKYSADSQRPVTISGNVDNNGKTSIVVTNYGLAIEPDEQEKIFEKGVRGKNPQLLNISGTGVGLHLGRQIMRAQEGDLILMQRTDPIKFAMVLPGDL